VDVGCPKTRGPNYFDLWDEFFSLPFLNPPLGCRRQSHLPLGFIRWRARAIYCRMAGYNPEHAMRNPQHDTCNSSRNGGKTRLFK
jgi:hypothetical protein